MYNRRKFLKSFASLFPALYVNAELSNLYNLRDKYGGLKNIKFKSTGFFRTEFDGKRWWLVTPLGHGFITLESIIIMLVGGPKNIIKYWLNALMLISHTIKDGLKDLEMKL